ncbi:DUF2269 domain-containing protein [Corynebacterium comes]|uniref:DUF2269 domain-containing protein n=1 Tax=Corynebacterium comes TaxID=2675218 RepID=A0A6B8VG97_9CORY|nr:DUF2269 domain-containing protein [Corynebacterium comes]QGU04312.1 hypothetical protein CETAM_05205 [Corynebacterium comes]
MTTILIALHVLAAVLFIGPVTFAVSTFHVQAMKARGGDARAAGAAKILHKLSSTYGVLAAVVPLLGVTIMFTNSAYWSQGQFHIALPLAVVAWIILLVLIIPRQKKMMGALGLLDAADHDPEADTVADWDKARKQLSMFGGIFSLLWLIMFVLMYV